MAKPPVLNPPFVNSRESTDAGAVLPPLAAPRVLARQCSLDILIQRSGRDMIYHTVLYNDIYVYIHTFIQYYYNITYSITITP